MKRILSAICLLVTFFQANAGEQNVKEKFSKRNSILSEKRAALLNLTNPVLQNPVNGFVTDEEGKPISGVSVFMKGSKTGAITDANGKFSLEANKGDILIFSSIGFEKKEIIVQGDIVTVQLKVYISPLSQVVVSGSMVEIQRKADISSVTVLTAKDLQAMPGQTIDRLFTGVVPGVTVTSVGNQQSLTYSTVQIRGAGSMFGG